MDAGAQEEALFEEMRQVAASVKPTLVIFTMDGSIGQAAHDQAKAFKDSVEVCMPCPHSHISCTLERGIRCLVMQLH